MLNYINKLLLLFMFKINPKLLLVKQQQQQIFIDCKFAKLAVHCTRPKKEGGRCYRQMLTTKKGEKGKYAYYHLIIKNYIQLIRIRLIRII